MFTCGASFDDYLEGSRAGKTDEFVRALAAQVPAQFVAMRDSLREADILVEGGFMMAGPSQAELQHLPLFSFVQTPLLLDAERFPAAGVPLKKGLFDSTRGRRKEWEQILLPAINREREFSHLPPISNLQQYLYRSGHVLVATDPEIASLPASTSETVTGFWHFDDSGFSSEELRPFLDEGTPPLLIEPLGLPGEVAVSFLEQLGSQLSSAGIRGVVHPSWTDAGKAKLPDSWRVMEAFPTDRFAAVLHLGTAYMFSAAAHAGIPQITVPLLAEHGIWSDKAASLGLGPAAVKSGDPGRVASVVREAMSNSLWKEKCRAFAARVREQNGPAVAAETIERFGAEAVHGG